MKSFSIFVTAVAGFVVTLVVGVQVAHAEQSGFAFSPSLFYFANTVEETSKTTTTYMFIDVRLGYQTASGFHLGGIYAMDSIKVETTNLTVNSSITAYGPQVGYNVRDWYFLGAFHMSSEYKANETTTYTAGSGYQADVGHRFMMGSWGFAPQMSYRFLEYKKDKEGRTLANPYKRTDVVPYFAIWFFL